MSVLTGMQCQCFICKHPSGSKCDSQLLVESKRREAELQAREIQAVLENSDLAACVKTLEDAMAWRLISEIHEDYGPCVCINLIRDQCYVEVHWCTEVEFNESDWTHFARVPQLLTENADRLIEEYKQALAAKEPIPYTCIHGLPMAISCVRCMGAKEPK